MECPECGSADEIMVDDCEQIVSLRMKGEDGGWLDEKAAIKVNLITCGKCCSRFIQRGGGKPTKIERVNQLRRRVKMKCPACGKEEGLYDSGAEISGFYESVNEKDEKINLEIKALLSCDNCHRSFIQAGDKLFEVHETPADYDEEI